MNDTARALASVARRLADPADPLGARAREDLVADGAIAPAMADRVLRATAARYTPDALQALCDGAMEGRDVLVVLAASVPTAPLRALALPLLHGARRVRVRPSRRQTRFVETLCSLAPFDRVARVGDYHPARGEHIVAYGSDETLAALRASLPEGATFEGHGHGFGAALVTAGADLAYAAVHIARDVADYDQRGCLSPQGVFSVGTTADAVALARAIHRALGQEIPRGPLDPAEAARVVQWQGVMAVQGELFLRGAHHAVAVLSAPGRVGSPGARNVAVVPVRDPDEAARLLAADAAYLTCVGVAGDMAAVVVPPGAAPRVVAAGTMQDPALDGPEDPRPPWR